MPYYVYRVFTFPIRRLERVDAKESFREASTLAKAARAAGDLPSGATVRVIFADSELQAEDLLSQVREGAPGVVGDE